MTHRFLICLLAAVGLTACLTTPPGPVSPGPVPPEPAYGLSSETRETDPAPVSDTSRTAVRMFDPPWNLKRGASSPATVFPVLAGEEGGREADLALSFRYNAFSAAGTLLLRVQASPYPGQTPPDGKATTEVLIKITPKRNVHRLTGQHLATVTLPLPETGDAILVVITRAAEGDTFNQDPAIGAATITY